MPKREYTAEELANEVYPGLVAAIRASGAESVNAFETARMRNL